MVEIAIGKMYPYGKAGSASYLLFLKYPTIDGPDGTPGQVATYVATQHATAEWQKINVEPLITTFHSKVDPYYDVDDYVAHDDDLTKLEFESVDAPKLIQLEYLLSLLNAKAFYSNAFKFNQKEMDALIATRKPACLADKTIDILITTTWQQFCINTASREGHPFQLCSDIATRQHLIEELYGYLKATKRADATTLSDGDDGDDMLARTFDEVRVHSKSISAMPILDFPAKTAEYADLFKDPDPFPPAGELELADPATAAAGWRLYGNAHHIYAQFPQLSVSANTLASAQGSATHFNFTLALTKHQIDKADADLSETDGTGTRLSKAKAAQDEALKKEFHIFANYLQFNTTTSVDFDTLVDLSFNINPLVSTMAHRVCDKYFKSAELHFVGSDLPCMIPFLQNNDAVYASYADAVHVNHIEQDAAKQELLVTELKTRWAASLAFSNTETETLTVANSTHVTNLRQTLMQALSCDFWYSTGSTTQTQLITTYVPDEMEPEFVWCQRKSVAYSHKIAQALYANMMLRGIMVTGANRKTAPKMPTHYTDAYMSVRADSAAYVMVLILLMKTAPDKFPRFDDLTIDSFKIVPTIAALEEHTMFMPQVCLTGVTAESTVEHLVSPDDYDKLRHTLKFTDAHLQQMAMLNRTGDKIDVYFVEQVTKGNQKFEAGTRALLPLDGTARIKKIDADSLLESSNVVLIRSCGNALHMVPTKETAKAIDIFCNHTCKQAFDKDQWLNSNALRNVGTAPLWSTLDLPTLSDRTKVGLQEAKDALDRIIAEGVPEDEGEDEEETVPVGPSFSDEILNTYRFEFNETTRTFNLQANSKPWQQFTILGATDPFELVYDKFPYWYEKELAYITSVHIAKGNAMPDKDNVSFTLVTATPSEMEISQRDQIQDLILKIMGTDETDNEEINTLVGKINAGPKEPQDVFTGLDDYESGTVTCKYNDLSKPQIQIQADGETNTLETGAQYETYVKTKLLDMIQKLQTKEKQDATKKWQYRIPLYEDGKQCTCYLFSDAKKGSKIFMSYFVKFDADSQWEFFQFPFTRFNDRTPGNEYILLI